MSKAKVKRCPKCDGETEQIYICPECYEEGCLERCNPGGNNCICLKCEEGRENAEEE